MQTIELPVIGTAAAWRRAARMLARRSVAASKVDFVLEGQDRTLFANNAGMQASPRSVSKGKSREDDEPVTVPKSFVPLAESVVCHSDPERFSRLYAMLLRLQKDRTLLSDRADADVARLFTMEKAIRRDVHKMKAFVRFRELAAEDGARRRFGAWFEPDHFIAEYAAPFFARRFGDMDFIIATPSVSVTFRDGSLSFSLTDGRPAMDADETQELWATYFENIFNPARLKIKAMQAEMPKKYWKNLPEAALIPALIETAEARVSAMHERMAGVPPKRAARLASKAERRN